MATTAGAGLPLRAQGAQLSLQGLPLSEHRPAASPCAVGSSKTSQRQKAQKAQGRGQQQET